MIIKKMFKLILNSIIIYLFVLTNTQANDEFSNWVIKFQNKAIKSGISEKVVKDIMSDVRFLPKVIEYDRYQPEFYEDTFTYIKKDLLIVKSKKVKNYTIKKN